MTINDREIKFRRTVYVTCLLSERAPGKDVRRYEELFDESNLGQTFEASAYFVHALSIGYEKWKAMTELGYEQHPVTLDELMCLDESEFLRLFAEAMEVFKGDAKQTVEAQPKKKTGKKTEVTKPSD